MIKRSQVEQLIALKYGSVPIIHETGGLKDNVIFYSKYTEKGNGFSFNNYRSDELLDAVNKALDLYKDKVSWNKLISNAMLSNNSWENSAKKYMNLYSKIVKQVFQ